MLVWGVRGEGSGEGKQEDNGEEKGVKEVRNDGREGEKVMYLNMPRFELALELAMLLLLPGLLLGGGGNCG